MFHLGKSIQIMFCIDTTFLYLTNFHECPKRPFLRVVTDPEAFQKMAGLEIKINQIPLRAFLAFSHKIEHKHVCQTLHRTDYQIQMITVQVKEHTRRLGSWDRKKKPKAPFYITHHSVIQQL